MPKTEQNTGAGSGNFRRAPLGANAFSFGRIGALVLRHLYLIRGSWARVIELIYWPVVHLIMWGFLQNFLDEQGGTGWRIANMLVGAVFLWEVLFRGQINFSLSFLEEMWSRNLGAILTSPLRPFELILALMVMSIIRSLIGLIPAALIASFMFDFSFPALGFWLVGFILNLTLFGWAVALVASGFVLRNGMGSESLVWAALFIFLPLSCIYYPLATLPEWLQPVAAALPASWVFEGMRAILWEGTGRMDFMLRALGLNVLYMTLGAFVFMKFLSTARRRGMLLQLGE